MTSHSSKEQQEQMEHSTLSTPTNNKEEVLYEDDDIEVTWRSWAVVFAASLNYFAFALILTASGFWAGDIVASVGGAPIRVWISSAWIPVSAVLAAPLARIGDNCGRKYIWLVATAFGVMGNILIAAAPNVGAVICGVAFWGVCFGNAGNVLTAPAEILPRRHRGTANMWLQIGGYGGTTTALLGGAGMILNTPASWRGIFYMTAAVYALVFVFIVVFYTPPPVPNPQNKSYVSRLLDFDIVGTILFACFLFPLLLGLIWGGVSYPWKSAAVISSLVIGCVFFVLMAIHQTFLKKDGLFAHELFHDRNVVLCLIGIFTEGFAYIIFNSYLGQEVATLWDATPYGLALRFCAFIWAAAFASAVYIVICYKYRALYELLSFGFGLFLIACICFATVKPGSSSASIAYTVIAGLGTAAPISFLFAAVQLSVPPRLTGAACGLMVAFRQVGGSIGPSVCNAVFVNKLSSALPKFIAEAGLKAGLPASSLPTFVKGLASGNATMAAGAEGVTPAILAAGHSAALSAYASSFKFVWIIIIPFVFASLVACLLMKGLRERMNQIVDRPMEKQHHHHHAHRNTELA